MGRRKRSCGKILQGQTAKANEIPLDLHARRLFHQGVMTMPVQRHTLREGFWPAADFASDACVRHYKGEGWIVLQGFYDVEREILPVHRELNGLIRLKLDQLGLSATCPGDQQLI